MERTRTLPQYDGAPEVRTYQAGDAVRIAAAWTEAAPADGITARRFRDLILLDRNFDAAGLFVAEEGGRVVGAAYAVRRLVAHEGADLQSETGWIPFFFVVPSSRGEGLGRILVQQAMTWLRERGASEVVFSGYTPNYVLPGLDTERYPAAAVLLKSLGFETLERPSAMDRSLLGYAMPDEVRFRITDLRDAGWYFGSPGDDDLVALIRIAGDAFNSDWARAIREGIVGGMPEERVVIAKDPAGELLGWAMHGTYESVVERFGPFGVLPASRGTGIGKILLHLTLERMVSLGAHSAWFLWADEGSTASALYARTGFVVTRTFDILRAKLNGEADD